MAQLHTQSGMVLMAVLIILLLIPATIMLIYQGSSAFSMNIAAESSKVELGYLLDAAESHAKYFADINDSCTNFANMPVTTFGQHTYQAAITQNPSLPQQLFLNVSATLADGRSASRLVRHTAYQPEVSGILRPSVDTTADSGNPNEGAGTDEILTIYNDGSEQSYGLIKFEPGGVILPETKLVSAMLELQIESFVFNGPIIPTEWLGLHPIGRKWKEDADWQTHDGNKNWRPLGVGEPVHSNTALATLSHNPGQSIGFDVTSTVNRWLQEGDSFYGFLIKAYQSPLTLEVASRDNANFDSRPRLQVTYSCPCGRRCLIQPRRQYLDRVKAKTDPDTSARLCDADGDYRGSHGDIRWTFNPWTENGDDGNPCTGAVRLDQDPVITEPNAYQIKFTADSKSLQRDAWLRGASHVFVSFRYRREGLSNTNQRLFLKASNGGGLQTLLTIDGGVTDAEYQDASVEIPASLVGEESSFMLYAEDLSDTRYYYVDEFSISFEGAVTPPKRLPIVFDSYMDEDEPDDKFATDDPIRLKHKPTANRNIIAKVSAAGMYEGEIINGAMLRLWVDDNSSDRDSILRVYSLDESWHPTQVTWNDRERDVVPWATPGGTYSIPADPADTPTYFLPEGTENLWIEFDLTSYVQSWSDFPATNHGLVLTMDDTGRGKEIKILSSETNTSSKRPHVELQ